MTFRLWFAFATLLLGASAYGQAPEIPLVPTTDLTLADSVRIALEHSPEVLLAQSTYSRAILEWKQVRSVFWPSWKSRYQQDESAAPSIFATQTGGSDFLITDKALSFDSGIYGKLPTETEIFTRFSTSKTATSSADALLSPYYFSRLEFGGTQPLLKGFDWSGGMGNTWRALRVASRNRDASGGDFRASITEIVASVQMAYLNLLGCREILGARQKGLAITREQADATRKRITAGLLVPAEIFQVEERISSRKQDLLRAQQECDREAAKLFGLLGFPDGGTGPESLHPIDPLAFEPYPLTSEEILQRVDRASPKLAALRERQEAKRIEMTQKRSLMLPKLDLTGSFFLNGGNTPTTPGYSNDIDQLLGGDANGFNVMAVLEVPLGPDVDRSEYRLVQLEYEKALRELDVERMRVRTDVLRLFSEVHAGQGIVEAAHETSDLAGKKLDFERKKFENGLTTSFSLLTYQEDLTEARVQETEALQNYQRSRIGLEILTGETLDRFQIRVEETSDRWKASTPGPSASPPAT